MAVASGEGKGRLDGQQLLTDRLKTLDQGVFHCIARTRKIELGASLLALDRLSTMAMASGEGKGRGDGQQLLTDRLKTLGQGVFLCIARTLKIELGVSPLDRLGMMAMASGEGKGRVDGQQ